MKETSKIITSLDFSNIQKYKVCDSDVELLAFKAKEYGMNTIVVCPSSLPIVNRILKNSSIKIAVAVSYPAGAYFMESKKEEIEEIVNSDFKVDEIYMVMAVGRFLSGYEKEAVDEINMFAKEAKGKTTKLVIEASQFTYEQKEKLCEIAINAGIDYIVASTGFEPYDVPMPTISDIKDLVKTSKGKVKIIACGNINTMHKTMKMLEAGADRVCTTEADKIIEEL